MSMMSRAPAGCSSGISPPREAGATLMMPRLPAGEGLLSSPGFCPPGEALRRPSGFCPPREAGAASMMPRSPAGVGRRFRSDVGPYVKLPPIIRFDR